MQENVLNLINTINSVYHDNSFTFALYQKAIDMIKDYSNNNAISNMVLNDESDNMYVIGMINASINDVHSVNINEALDEFENEFIWRMTEYFS